MEKLKAAARQVTISLNSLNSDQRLDVKDDRGRPLEPQWFYVPEMDEDQERATLIRSMMPRPGKRNETKKYKQYYYRPLDKISRWDPEDSL